MKKMTSKSLRRSILIWVSCAGLALAQTAFTKIQVGDRIRKVEDGVDEFRKWAENRGEQGKTQAQAAKNNGRTRSRTGTDSQKTQAHNTKDDLEDALSDLNRSTNRLRRKFDPTDKWMETRPQVERVLDDARRINQVMVRGHYGSQAERYWSVLRANINDPGTSKECVSVFDQQGALWARLPMYFPNLFALDRVKTVEPQHSECVTKW